MPFDTRQPLSIQAARTINVGRGSGGGVVGNTPVERQFIIDINGDGGTVGGPVANSTGILDGKQVFTGTAGGTTYSNEMQYEGSNVLRMSVAEGSQGFGSLGGAVNLQNHQDAQTYLYRGDEFWMKTRMYFPSGGWQWNEGRNKFFRARVFNPDGSSSYIDLYIDGNRSTGTQIWWIYEGENSWRSNGSAAPDVILFDQWHDIEMYCRLDSIPSDEGGMAHTRIWIDGDLIMDIGNRRTINHPDSEIRNIGLFLYYGNEGAPSDLHLFADNYIFRTSLPSNTDAAGNPFIGANS